MGTYIDRSDVERRFGASNVATWSNTDNDDTGAIEATITEAISKAEAMIEDRFRGSRYRVPFIATSGSLAAVKDWAAMLAGYWLYTSRGMDEDDRFGGQLAEMKEQVEAEIAAYLMNSRRMAAAQSDSSMPSCPEVV